MRQRRVTVFGGSGFIGRYLVKRLATDGAVIRVAVRDAETAKFLRPLGAVGQVVPFATSILRDDSVRRAVEGAEEVVNLVGILAPSGRQTFSAVHVAGAERVARAAREAGVNRLVQMSALGASPDSTSEYARTKADGEAAALEHFPDASITRPGIVFGVEDDFFNRFAAMARITPALPLIGGGHTRFQPVWAGDVAEAIQRILERPETGGQTYELGGPRTYTFRELMELMLRETGRHRLLAPLPFGLARFQARFLELLPKPPLTRDQVELLKQDNVVSEGALGFPDLGIEPTALEVVLPTYMDRFRSGGRFARRVRSG